MSAAVRTVIIPAAGQGTRLLPATKAVPKELMPVYDRPVLQFALDEAVAAGAERIVVVIHPSKATIRDYLRPDEVFIADLRDRSKHDLADTLSALQLPAGVDVVFAIQARASGLGDAVGCCRGQALPGPIGIILPDDVIFGEPCLVQMAEHYREGHMVAAMDVTPAETSSYGIFRTTGSARGRTVEVSGMVEKPAPGAAPSRLAAVGRYLLDPCILSTLAETPRGAGGEVQLTDAIATDAAHMPLTAFRFTGTRYDCGTHDGLIDAALARQTLAKRQHAMLSAAQ